MGDYSKMTVMDEKAILVRLLDKMTPDEILQLPGAYEVISAALQDDVEMLWEEANTHLAFPPEEQS